MYRGAEGSLFSPKIGYTGEYLKPSNHYDQHCAIVMSNSDQLLLHNNEMKSVWQRLWFCHY